MVICKYYQRGHCRYEGYCRFEHVDPTYSFYSNNSISNKSFTDPNKSVAQIIAEEVLAAERGGQWILSCYGPFKEQPCIPGFDDVSLEEVRWQMYQARKSGTVEQAKLQFEQLRQAASAKREAFKNPSHETIAMLEALQSGNKSPSTFGSKPSFALATPQLGSTSSNPFGAKTFGTSTFGGTFSSTTAATPSIFSRPTTAAASGNVFGAKPAFGGPSIFGNQVAPPAFGGTTTPSVFGGSNPSPFNASQSSSPFGATSQTFGASSSLFGGATTIQPVVQPTNSPFGARAPASGSSMFGQPPAFGAASVFGASPAFGATSGSFSTQTTPFSSPQATPFNTTQATTFSTTQTTPFSSAPSVFGGNSAAATTNFNAMPPSFPSTQTSTFAAPAATTASIFSRPFAEPVAPPAFGAVSTFGAPNTTSSANVFTAAVVTSPSGTTAGGMSTGPFGKSTTEAPIPSNCHTNYSMENALTDDEKNSFLADKFILGKIPLKPPTIELR